MASTRILISLWKSARPEPLDNNIGPGVTTEQRIVWRYRRYYCNAGGPKRAAKPGLKRSEGLGGLGGWRTVTGLTAGACG